MEAPELTQNAANERSQPEKIEATTAFVVFVTPTGQILASPDMDLPLEVSRAPSEDEIGLSCYHIVESLRIAKTANHTAQIVVGTMMQAGQQMQNQAVTDKLIKDINAGRVPPPR